MTIAAIALAGALARTQPTCSAAAIYAAARSASGGFLWDKVAEVASRGAMTAEGLRGKFRLDVDVRSGDSSLRQALGVQHTREVNTRRMLWQQDYSRGVHPLDSPNARRAAITAAYLNRHGPWSPWRDAASFHCLGSRERNGRTFDVVSVTPHSGLPVEQWIDAGTHLVDRSLVRMPTRTDFTQFSDYREVGGVVLPFSIRTGSVGDPSDDVVLYVRSVDLRKEVRGDDFRRPPPPADTRMLAGKATTVPIAIEAGDVIVFAKIDGKGPFPFILDTGGHAILTPAAARSIGLPTHGAASSGGAGSGRVSVSYTYVHSLRIGNAQIPNQPFLVIGYDNDFSDRGSRMPIAGILGLEVFERFAVRIDYARSLLTLTLPAAYDRPAAAASAAIVFQEDMPLTRAAADEATGWFGVDTGNSGSLVMFGPFLARHGFLARYRLGTRARGTGTGGAVQSRRQVIERFAVGGRTFRDVVTYFVIGQVGGSFSSTTEAGNFGYQVLANFTPTFDYASGAMYLEKTSGAPAPALARSGLVLSKLQHAVFHVDSVRPGSPAASVGIAAGDEIVAIDGKVAARLGNADVYWIMRRPPGTVVTLVVRRGGRRRVVALTLRIMSSR